MIFALREAWKFELLKWKKNNKFSLPCILKFKFLCLEKWGRNQSTPPTPTLSYRRDTKIKLIGGQVSPELVLSHLPPPQLHVDLSRFSLPVSWATNWLFMSFFSAQHWVLLSVRLSVLMTLQPLILLEPWGVLYCVLVCFGGQRSCLSFQTC